MRGATGRTRQSRIMTPRQRTAPHPSRGSISGNHLRGVVAVTGSGRGECQAAVSSSTASATRWRPCSSRRTSRWPWHNASCVTATSASPLRSTPTRPSYPSPRRWRPSPPSRRAISPTHPKVRFPPPPDAIIYGAENVPTPPPRVPKVCQPPVIARHPPSRADRSAPSKLPRKLHKTQPSSRQVTPRHSGALTRLSLEHWGTRT